MDLELRGNTLKTGIVHIFIINYEISYVELDTELLVITPITLVICGCVLWKKDKLVMDKE